MQSDLPNQEQVFLSTELAGRRETRFALGAILLSVVVFFIAVPFAKTPLAQVPAFIPIYVSLLVICDLITAVLLFGQYSFLRSRALLVLASGYLFTASIVFAYTLIFPGLFPTSELFGAGPQTTSAMYMYWHSGFPIVIIVYTSYKYRGIKNTGTSASPAIFFSIIVVLAAVAGFTYFVTAGHSLPVFIDGNHTSNLGHIVLFCVWMLSILALIILWLRRPYTTLDLWLMVVMCAWLCDIGLGAVFNTGRYDLGWYTGRVYGVLAASSLLIVLLNENVAHYARLTQLSAKLSDANKALEQLSIRDGLTDLANRRFFDTYLANQIAIAHRHKRTLALILYDIDSFKAYNDHYGHQAGDECLKQVAAVLRTCCRRPTDIAARYGGEEFAMILPDTELVGAAYIAEAAREAVAQLNIPHIHSTAVPYVSISGGVAILLLTSGVMAKELIESADQVLYKAKNLGRNRIVSMQVQSI